MSSSSIWFGPRVDIPAYFLGLGFEKSMERDLHVSGTVYFDGNEIAVVGFGGRGRAQDSLDCCERGPGRRVIASNTL